MEPVMARALLLGTPPEIFALVTLHLDAADLFTLFLAGDAVINARLFRPGNVTRFKLVADAKPIRFPSFVYLFPTLLEIELHLGYFTKCFGVTKATYHRLPKCLRKLKICAESSGFPLLSPIELLVPTESEEARLRHLKLTIVNLAETFPQLQALELNGSWSELSPLEYIVFPESLTSLDIHEARISSPAFLSVLPPFLTSLSLGRIPFTDENISFLPRTLKTLILGLSTLVTPKCIDFLPSELEVLSLEACWSKIEACSRLPETLQSFSFQDHFKGLHEGLPVSLPPNLTSFDISSSSVEKWILPHSLKYLRYRTLKNVDFTFLETFPPGLLSFVVDCDYATVCSTTLECLPRCLTKLDVTRVDLENSDTVLKLPPNLSEFAVRIAGSRCTAEHFYQLQKACPKLQKLDLPHEMQFGSDESIVWPQMLEELGLESAKLNLHSVAQLPCSLTILTLRLDEQLNGHGLALLPRSLTWLSLRTITNLGDEDVIHFPRGLRHLSLLSTQTWHDACIPHLPRKLIRLVIESKTAFTNNGLAHLPRSLVSLTCGGGEALSPAGIPYLPLGLSTLMFHGNPALTREYVEHQGRRLSTRPKPSISSFSI